MDKTSYMSVAAKTEEEALQQASELCKHTIPDLVVVKKEVVNGSLTLRDIYKETTARQEP